MGVPTIGARSGGIPDLIGHVNAAWLFTPGDANDLASRMQQAMDLGRAGLPAKPDFTPVLRETRPDIVAERYLAFYRDVLAARLARVA